VGSAPRSNVAASGKTLLPDRVISVRTCFPVERMEQVEHEGSSPGKPGLYRLFHCVPGRRNMWNIPADALAAEQRQQWATRRRA